MDLISMDRTSPTISNGYDVMVWRNIAADNKRFSIVNRRLSVWSADHRDCLVVGPLCGNIVARIQDSMFFAPLSCTESWSTVLPTMTNWTTSVWPRLRYTLDMFLYVPTGQECCFVLDAACLWWKREVETDALQEYVRHYRFMWCA